MELLAFLGMDVSGWLTGAGLTVVVGIIVTVLRKKGYIGSIKFWAKRIGVITQQIGEALLETSDVFEKIDEAIKDDGTLKENSIKEILAEGKEAIVEWKDAIVSIKPKK